jgi:hypothetical protein
MTVETMQGIAAECCVADVNNPSRGLGCPNGAHFWCRCGVRWAKSAGVWVRWELGSEKPLRD